MEILNDVVLNQVLVRMAASGTRSADDRTRDAIRRIAGRPDEIETAVKAKGTWHSYVELHIEQGGTLDKARIPIGIVEGIVAIHRYDVVIDGQANHAGKIGRAHV